MSKKKIEWVIWCQLICAVFITFSHSFSSKVSNPSWSEVAISITQSISLSMFMFTSGFLTEETGQLSKYGYKLYIARRARRLLIPFFAIQIIMLFPKYILDSDKSNYDFAQIIHGFLAPREGVLPHLWFLCALFIICTLMPLLGILLKHNWSIICGTIFFVAITVLPDIPNYLCLNDVKKYIIWFFLGLSFSKLKIIDLINKNRAYVLPLSAFLFIAYFVIINYGNHNWGLLLFAKLISVFLMILISSSLPKTWGGLNKIGIFTFPVYILSLPVQNIVELVYARLGIGWLLTTCSMLIAGLAVPVIVSFIIIRLDKKCNATLGRLLIGL